MDSILGSFLYNLNDSESTLLDDLSFLALLTLTFLVGSTCNCNFLSSLICVTVKLKVIVNSSKNYIHSVEWFI